MRDVDTLIVGGGPAGSAAATRLMAAGADVLLLDQERFPRPKLCAGWITPAVLRDLRLDIADYPHSFLSFRRLHFHWRRIGIPVPCVQHSIRRLEFDAWLLERSQAEVLHHTVKDIRAIGDGYVIDDAFRCRYLIGAGGTRCPVRRSLFSAARPRDRRLQTVTLELEFAYDWRDPDCHLWFFDRGLRGYSWYVPKSRGFLNVGIGAMAQHLKERGETIREHWSYLIDKLQRRFGIKVPDDPAGYSYYVRGPTAGTRIGNALLTGDSADLATRDLCEGIGPAIRSGQLAAETILTGRAYELDEVEDASLGGGWISRRMERAFMGAGSGLAS